MRCCARFKLAPIEGAPTITPYDEHAWAALRDTDAVPLDVLLRLLETGHERSFTTEPDR